MFEQLLSNYYLFNKTLKSYMGKFPIWNQNK